MDGLDFGGQKPIAFTSKPSNLNTSIASGGLTIDGQSSGGVSGSGGGGVDPYAKYGGTAKYNSMTDSFNKQKNVIFDTAGSSAEQGGRKLRGNILDFIDQFRSGQQKIDQSATNNELAKKQGVAGVQGMVGRGIRSGGVTLANKNASDSSAAGAIARAYGDIGGRELRDIGNQYEQQNQEIGLQQEDLGRQADQFSRHYEEDKQSMVNSIVSDAQLKLASLDAAIVDADLPDRIAIEQEKARIKSNATDQLYKYDSLLKAERGKIRPTSVDQRRIAAEELQNAGTDLGEGAFNFSEQVPAQFAGGPFSSDLPLFSFGRGGRREG